jgi:hypothetical protein
MRRFSSLAVLLFLTIGARAAGVDKSVILYLPFEEGKGDTTKDYSDTKIDGTLVNSPKWVDGRFGKALEFNGKDNYVEIPLDVNAHVDKGELSLCAWVKVYAVATDAHGQTRQPIIMKGNGAAGWEFALYVYDTWGAGQSYWQCGGTGVTEPGAANTLVKGTWHAVCSTFKVKGATRVYVDGKVVIEDGARNGEICKTGTRPIRIASREDGQFLNAAVDEVRIYDRELTADEVASSMGAPLGGLAVNPEGQLATRWARLKLVD